MARVRDYTKQIDIQSATDSTSAGSRGQKVKTWGTVECVFGSIRQLSGEEAVTAKQIDAKVTHEVRMHFTDNVTEESKLVYKTREFGIRSVDNVEERNRELVLMCSEIK